MSSDRWLSPFPPKPLLGFGFGELPPFFGPPLLPEFEDLFMSNPLIEMQHEGAQFAYQLLEKSKATLEAANDRLLDRAGKLVIVGGTVLSVAGSSKLLNSETTSLVAWRWLCVAGVAFLLVTVASAYLWRSMKIFTPGIIDPNSLEKDFAWSSSKTSKELDTHAMFLTAFKDLGEMTLRTKELNTKLGWIFDVVAWSLAGECVAVCVAILN